MKILFFITLFSVLSNNTIKANSTISIMSFNIMCDLCSHKNIKYDNFENRLESIGQLLKTNKNDIYVLQELRTKKQIEAINDSIGNHFQAIYYDTFFFSYPDPIIFFNQEKFELINTDYIWLGPNNGKFSLGWKWSLPRMLIKAKLKFKAYNQIIYLYAAHLDNLIPNKTNSLIYINQDSLKNENNSISLIAMDSNTRVFDEEYKVLNENFINTFSLIDINKYANLSKIKQKDYCYLHKGSKFPKCLVDHILYIKSAKLKVKDWKILLDKFNGFFPSDHRPIISTLELLNN